MAEIEVTEAMLRTGIETMNNSPSPQGSNWLPPVYRAMRALESTTLPDPIRHTAMEYAARCAPSRADLIPLARAIEAYLRGEVEPKPPVSLRDTLREVPDCHMNGLVLPPPPYAA